MNRFKPKKQDGGAIFMVNTEPCKICKKDMVFTPRYPDRTFPAWIGNNFKAQSKRGGFMTASNIKVDNCWICEECAKSGKATFLCALCNERRPTTEVKEEAGDPPEFLCTPCFKSVTAEKWVDANEKLYNRHRFDFE
jgi:hypothetical protein